ncbi:MAG: helix-turn-helix domain-containing protein [Candidatus Zambryskibacteria bacterium]
MFDEKELNKELQTLGLDKRSASVYMALLELGEVGSSKIIKKTGLHGQYVYQSIEKLEKEGLAQHVIKRGRKKFTAKSPSVLVRIAEEQKIKAENLVSDLNKLMVLPPEQTFETFQGRESYIAHEFELLEKAKENCELLIIGGARDRFNEEMGKHLREYARIQEQKNISIRYIGSDDQRAVMPEMHSERQNFKIRYLPGLFTGEVNTNIWPDVLGFNIYGEPVTRFTVYNKTIAQSYKQFFETLWKLAKE